MKTDAVGSSRVLDPLDVQARLEELRRLEPGWLDGEGEAFDPEGITWLEASMRDHYVTGTPMPHIFPSPDGEVVFQWKIGHTSATLEIDLREKSGYWHALDLSTRKDSDADLELDGAAGWRCLAERLAALAGEEA